jgi:hypothetical protein
MNVPLFLAIFFPDECSPVLGYLLDSSDDDSFSAFRATDANATPVSTYRGMLSRSRKNAGPTRFVSAGAPPSADPETPALSTSSSELVKSSPENASAVPDADHGASPGRGNEQDLEAAEKQSEARFGKITNPDEFLFLVFFLIDSSDDEIASVRPHGGERDAPLHLPHPAVSKQEAIQPDALHPQGSRSASAW